MPRGFGTTSSSELFVAGRDGVSVNLGIPGGGDDFETEVGI
jgi:hypothetical protein